LDSAAPFGEPDTSTVPTVSVVIIFLNADKFLREAIDSVMSQTLSSWELFLVDDGSTDGSTQIARSFARDSPEKIHYLEHEGHENRGMSASRNVGIARARGEFVAFLDADDIWFPEKLQRQVAILTEHPEAGFLANPTVRCYSDGARERQPMALSPGLLPPGAWIPKILENDDNTSVPSSVLIRTRVLREVGGFEESFRALFEDQITWFKINLTAAIYYDPEPLIFYRIHAESCCVSTPTDQQAAARIVLYARLTELIQEKARPCANRRMLLAIARTRLGELLAESDGPYRAGANGTDAPGVLYHRRIGVLFSGVLLLGSVSKGTAVGVFRKMFILLSVTYDDGLLGGAKSLLGLAVRAARKLAPSSVQP
jgi:glycosyltransferase involved in cell wall biosynthesis